MSDIKEKIEIELKPLETVCEKALENLKYALECPECKSAEEIMYLAKTHGAIVDSKKDIVEMCYKKQILEAMEESEFGEDYDEEGPVERRFYRGQPRDSRGRYMSRNRMYHEPDYRMTPEMYRENSPEHLRDMDRNKGIMYYTESGMNRASGNNGQMSRSGESTRTGRAMRHYEETKEMHNTNSAEDKEHRMKAMTELMDEFKEEMMEKMRNASPEEKTILKKKMMNLSEQM